jgi:hypothetical protein
MMGDLQKGQRKTYCWRGFAVAMLGGWLPAWGLTHGLNWGGWGFAGIWAACIPAGYFLGKLIQK